MEKEDLKELAVPFLPGAHVAGTIPRTAEMEAPRSRRRVELVSEDPGGPTYTVPWNADGTFAFRDVAPGAYRVYPAELPETWYVHAVRIAEQELPGSILNLGPGMRVAVEVALSPEGGRVSGSVRNERGLPVADALVTLAPDGGTEPRLFRSTRTGEAGQFTIAGLAPGEYRVFAWEDADPDLAMDPEFLAAFPLHAVAVELRQAGTAELTLKLIPRGASEAVEAGLR